MTENKPSRAILYTIMIGAFFSMFDAGMVNVGLPVIAGEFKTGIQTVQWTSSIYLLVMSALLPIFGSLADRLGRGRIYNAGFLTVSVFTLLCGFAPNFTVLIVFRILQAIGGAMVMANGMAIATESYPPSERGRNIGILASAMAVGSIAGPSLGGLIIGLSGWRSVFYATFALSFAAFAVSYFTIPRQKKQPTQYHIDIMGSILLIVTIVSFIYGFSNLNNIVGHNYSILFIVGLFLLTAVALILWELKHKHPVFDLRLFRNLTFSSSIISALISFATMYSPTVLVPFYLQKTLGFSPIITGLYMMAFPVAMALLSPLSGSLSDKIGSRSLAIAALVLNGIALIIFAFIPADLPSWFIMIPLSVMGIGLGMFQSPNNSTIMGSVPKERLGAANGITQLVKNLGMVIGITFSTMVFTMAMGQKPYQDKSVFLASARWVYLGSAILSFIGAWAASMREKEMMKTSH